MKDIYRIILTLILASVFQKAQSTPSGQSEFEKEALSLVTEKENLLKRGDFQFGVVRNRQGQPGVIYQYSGLTREVIAYRSSQADRLNGTDWSGVIRYSAEARRVFQNGRWGRWENVSGKMVHAWNLKKEKGRWLMDFTLVDKAKSWYSSPLTNSEFVALVKD